ncbi:MAG: 23S rRNA (uracil(1939)-C(5))-methyltransferase RlmD [Eubacteriales bacterium]|nr:23S rRNA (uracil(1939)-C(5))-methyltransferase RlmD [Eubacteriales bacterium]
MPSCSYDEKNKTINCCHSLKCGSCVYSGMKYENELKVKQDYVSKLFKGVCNVEDIVGMYRPIYYRNKVHAAVGQDKNGNIITGSYQENSHKIVDTGECLIEDKVCKDIIITLKQLFKSFKYKPYNEDTGKGYMRHILLRRGFSTKEIMLVLVTGDNTFPSKNAFVKVLMDKHPEITTIVQNINSSNTSMILGKISKVIYGKGYIEDVLCGCRFRISASSFYQINPQQTEKLYKTAIKMADITSKDTVIDAYCGIGTIGIAASKKAGKVIGVELNSEAVKDAEINAEINNIKNISFVNEDAGKFLVDYVSKHKADVVFMDPPRSGSSKEFLDSLGIIKPKRIVYISCNPETQRRDVEVLMKYGYEVKKMVPFDMFPHTEHVECVTLLQRKNT